MINNKEHIAIKAGIWYVISQLFVRSVSFFVTPIFSRLLTTAQFGQVKVYESWLQILLPILSVCLYSSVEKAKYEFEGELNEYLSSIQCLSILISICFTCITLPFKNSVEDLLGVNDILLLIIFLYCLTHSAVNCYQKREKLFFKYKSNIFTTMLITIPSFMCAIFLVVWGIKNNYSEYLHYFRIIGFYLPQILLGLILICLLIKRGKCLYRKDFWSFALKFSIPMIPHFIALQILNQSDKIMIDKLCDTSKVGLFSLASTIMYILYLLQNAVGDAFLPWMYEKLNQKSYKEIEKIWFLIIIGCCYMSFAIVLYAPEIIYFLGGIKYEAANYLVPPIVCSALFNFISFAYVHIELFYKKTRLVALASSFSVIANLIFNYIGIRLFGYIAPAYTTAFCYLIMIVTHAFVVKHFIGEYIISLKKILLISLIIFMINLLTMLSYNFNFIIRIIIGTGIILFIFIYFRREIMKLIDIFIKGRKKGVDK